MLWGGYRYPMYSDTHIISQLLVALCHNFLMKEIKRRNWPLRLPQLRYNPIHMIHKRLCTESIELGMKIL